MQDIALPSMGRFSVANLRTWRLRVTPIFAVTDAVSRLPLLLVIFAWLGVALWTSDPNVVYWFNSSLIVTLAIAFGILRWLRHPSRHTLADALDENRRIRRAQRTLAELGSVDISW